MSNFFNNTLPYYPLPPPANYSDSVSPSDVEEFINSLGRSPAMSWDLEDRSASPGYSSVSQQPISFDETYNSAGRTFEPAIVNNYGSESAVWAGYESVTIYPPHTLHRPNAISVDGVPNRRTEISSSVITTDQKITIQSFRSPSPNVIPHPNGASSSNVPSPLSPTFTNTAASGSMQRRCDLPRCLGASGVAPFMNYRHRTTDKHMGQLLLGEKMEVRLHTCPSCGFARQRPDTVHRHMVACIKRPGLIQKGKLGRPKGRKSLK